MEVVKDKIKNVHDSFSKDKLRVLYNDLVETRTKMVIGGEQVSRLSSFPFLT